ncbi:DUF1329 domain-containing protein [Ferribacterium limneticum]|nr:DUF1329 domain-containing protein [Ferribacterium limneticum]
MNQKVIALALGALLSAQFAWAAVTPEEAARLKRDLTPFGAEKAGNKEGTIPAWDGGYTKVPAGYQSGDPRPDPFANEKPLFSITAKNMDQYADKLAEGTKALLKKYPTYRVDVYPTHRTAAAPQWVFDNTFKNSTRAKTTRGGYGVEGAYGGIPFPIPKDGYEAMHNHRLKWNGVTNTHSFENYTGNSDGKHVLVTKGQSTYQFPYYDKNGSLETFKGLYEQWFVQQTDPPFKSGEAFIIHDYVDQPRQAWQYLTGQRRVRKAPTIGYDTPDDVNSGQQYFDEAFVFLGDLDRYEWKLIGKKELYIPYNDNKYVQKSPEERLAPYHLNPDVLRWELHRVWVVEATLAPGKRHVVPKRRFYLDEDTWGAVIGEGWDAQGQLWRTNHSTPHILFEAQRNEMAYPLVVYNLLTGTFVSSGFNLSKGNIYKSVPRVPDSYFTPDALAGQGIR